MQFTSKSVNCGRSRFFDNLMFFLVCNFDIFSVLMKKEESFSVLESMKTGKTSGSEVIRSKINVGIVADRKPTKSLPISEVARKKPSDKLELRIKTSAENKKHRLKNAPDQFFRDGVRQVDFILAYDVKDDSNKKLRDYFHNSLINNGLQLEMETSETTTGQKIGFVKIHAPFDVLAEIAEQFRLKMPFKNVYHPQNLPKTWFESVFNCEWFSLPADYTETFETHSNYFARFQRKRVEMFVPYSDTSFFDPSHRIQFVSDVLCKITHCSDCPTDEMQSFSIERLLRDNVYMAAYPIHDGGKNLKKNKVGNIPLTDWNVRRLLNKFWSSLNILHKHQPILQIQHYYGSTVAVYFAWIGCYTRALIPAAVFGFLFFLYGLTSVFDDSTVKDVCQYAGDTVMCPTCLGCAPWKLADSCFFFSFTTVFANNGLIIYAVIMIMWSAWFLIYWKRKEATVCPHVEQIRIEYCELAKNTRITNPITGETEPFVSNRDRLLRKLLSWSCVSFLYMTIVSIVFVLISVRVHVVRWINNMFQSQSENLWKGFTFLGAKVAKVDRLIAAIICGIATAIVMVLADYFYEYLAYKLTTLECPRTMNDFEKSFIYKTFMFEILNWFGILFYLVIVKGNLFYGPLLTYKGFVTPEYCDPGGCMSELTIQIFVNIVILPIVFLVCEFILPLIRRKIRQKRKYAWKSKQLTQWEKDFSLIPPPDLPMVEEYEKIVVQFGFISLFSIAFPLAPLFALLNNMIEIRTDAAKWTRNFRRPVPKMATDIGPWYGILKMICVASVIINGAVIVFTSEVIQKFVYEFEFSDDGSFAGYMVHQLNEFRIPDNHTFWTHPVSTNSCWFGSYRNATEPFERSLVGYYMLMVKFAFLAIFFVLVGNAQRAILAFGRKLPKKLDTQIRREQFLARQMFLEVDVQHQIKPAATKNST